MKPLPTDTALNSSQSSPIPPNFGNAPDRAAWLRHAAHLLREAGSAVPPVVVDSPRLCAELLLAHGLGVSRTELAVYPDTLLPEGVSGTLDTLLERRLRGEPMAYVLGEKEFFGRPFLVTPATLIPRPETEHLIEHVLAACPASTLRFADLGTGSGCIALTLCAERPLWRGVAVDFSHDALLVAHKNARRLGVAARIQPVRADFTRPVLGACDLVVSNPPYIARPDYETLDLGVREFEPQRALTPGPSGLEHLEAVIARATQSLRPGGWVALEHAWDQGEAVQLLLKNNYWVNQVLYKDFSGHDRISMARRSCVSCTV